MLSMDSRWWKFALLAAIFAAREWVRQSEVVKPRENDTSSTQTSSREAEPPNATRVLVEVLDSAMIAFAFVFFIVLPFVLQAFYIPSGSMENTLRYQPSSDRLLVAKWVYAARDPQFLDVVVFVPPPLARANVGEDYIKRCIGVPGDVIEIQNRRVRRNGVLLKEPYVKWSQQSRTSSYDLKILGGVVYTREYAQDGTPGFWQKEGAVGQDDNGFSLDAPPNQQWIEYSKPEPIPAGFYLTLGDHRNQSADSHVWGLVPRANFRGKAMCVFWPPKRIGTLDRMSFLDRTRATSSTRSQPISPTKLPLR